MGLTTPPCKNALLKYLLRKLAGMLNLREMEILRRVYAPVINKVFGGIGRNELSTLLVFGEAALLAEVERKLMGHV